MQSSRSTNKSFKYTDTHKNIMIDAVTNTGQFDTTTTNYLTHTEKPLLY